jgi:hypothetical protein
MLDKDSCVRAQNSVRTSVCEGGGGGRRRGTFSVASHGTEGTGHPLQPTPPQGTRAPCKQAATSAREPDASSRAPLQLKHPPRTWYPGTNSVVSLTQVTLSLAACACSSARLRYRAEDALYSAGLIRARSWFGSTGSLVVNLAPTGWPYMCAKPVLVTARSPHEHNLNPGTHASTAGAHPASSRRRGHSLRAPSSLPPTMRPNSSIGTPRNPHGLAQANERLQGGLGERDGAVCVCMCV